jgi:phospholipid/cholesterol/gamma-HCH transport system substrate-binding protein
MKADDKKLELKIGSFVLVGVGLILTAILILGGKSSIFAPVYHFTTHFAKIDGLISGAKVGMGGLQVGTVSSVSFDGKMRDIEVKFAVEKKYAEYIRKDSSVEIVTQGVLGDKYLNLNSGDPAIPAIEDGGDVPQGASKDLSMLVSSSEKLMAQLTTTTESLDRILGAFNRGNRAEQFFQGLAATSKNLGDVSQKINNQMDDVKIKSAINHLNSILQKVDQGQGSLGAIINDPGLYDDAKALIGQVNRNRIMRNLIRQTIKDNKEKADEDEEKPTSPKK